MTYSTRGTYGGTPGSIGTTGPEAYAMLSANTVELPTAFQGYEGGTATVQGSTLTLTRTGCCGRPAQVWRFDQEGSNPELPASPLLLAVPGQVTLSASSGGPLPPSQVVQLTSSAAGSGLEVRNLSWTGSSASVNGLGASDWLSFNFGNGSSTPTSFTFSVYRTDIPAGTYHFTLEITGTGAGNLALIIPVTFNVAP